MDLDKLLVDALAAADGAAHIMRENFTRPHKIQHKGAVDLLTETDLAIEAFLRRELGHLLPEAAFVGEESSEADAANSGLCWVVDPVDGTTNFAHGIPVTAVSIALCYQGQPLLGIVTAPLLNECFYAARDSRAFCNGEPIAVSKETDIRQSLVATGFPYEMEGQLAAIIQRLEQVLPVTQGLRRPGSAAIDLCWLAAGRLEVFYENGLKPWDMAAGWLIVEEAGGRVTDFEGNDAGFGKSLLASNGHVHMAMQKLLRI